MASRAVERIKQLLALLRMKRAGNGVVFWYEAGDETAKYFAQLLVETGKEYQLDNRYRARFDRAHVPQQQDHLHVYLKQQQVCVINKDGTPSHQTTIDLPSGVRERIKDLGLVDIAESLLEEAGFTTILVPPDLVSAVEKSLPH